jgi:predicted metal-dependent hydrolase
VQSELSLTTNRPVERVPVVGLEPGTRNQPVVFVRHPRARRYILRLRPDGTARVTIPRGGSTAAARDFVFRQATWIQTQWERLKANPPRPSVWRVGSEFLFRGETVRIEAGANGDVGTVRFGTESLRVEDVGTDLRPPIERHLWGLAARELPPRLLAYARVLQLPVRRVTVRNQRTRWGSCSRRGTISLNWRLIQTPPFVRDYICLHELMHLREMNHSSRFWREVEAACPYYRAAEGWLKAHAALLH